VAITRPRRRRSLTDPRRHERHAAVGMSDGVAN
jgi:hypothetical protein